MQVKKIKIYYQGCSGVNKSNFMRFSDQTKSWYDAYAKKTYTAAKSTHVAFMYNKRNVHWLIYP